MSHDQRPGKIRVVQQAPRRRQDSAAIEGSTEVATGANAATAAGATAGAVGYAAGATRENAGGLPLVPALLFLLACIGGGVAVALLRPFGTG